MVQAPPVDPSAGWSTEPLAPPAQNVLLSHRASGASTFRRAGRSGFEMKAFLPDRAETVEDAMLAYEAVAVSREVTNSHLSREPAATARAVNARHCANSSSHSAPACVSFVSTYAPLKWSSSSERAICVKTTTTDPQPRRCSELTRHMGWESTQVSLLGASRCACLNEQRGPCFVKN